MQWKGAMMRWRHQTVAYLDRNGTVCVRSPYWSAARKLTQLGDPLNCAGLAWSRGADRLAVAVAPRGTELIAVRILSLDGALLSEATVFLGAGRGLKMLWSPSGSRLLVFHYPVEPPKGKETGGKRAEAVLFSEPEWRPVPVQFGSAPFHPLAWANDEVLAGGACAPGARPIRLLRFVRPLSQEAVGSFHSGNVSLGGPRVVHLQALLQPVQAAPSGAGIIAAFRGTSPAALSLEQGAAKLPLGRSRRWVGARIPWADLHPAPRVAYVYVPVSGADFHVIAVDDSAFQCEPALSPDGTELLYVSDWELRAAPLPAEARKRRKAHARRPSRSRRSGEAAE